MTTRNVFQPRLAERASAITEYKRTSASFIVAGSTLPRVEESLRIGELMRLAVMSQAKRVFGERCIPSVFSGHDMSEDNRHGHAFYLPEDSDGDGHIDHVLIHVENGLPGPAIRALDRISRLWERGGAEWQVLLEQYGAAEEIDGSRYLGTSCAWQSATPYLHPWFRKKNFTVEDQIRRECRERGLPEPEIEPIEFIMVKGRQRRWWRPRAYFI